MGEPCSTTSDSHVRAGEIVGVAGVEGNGQRALADVLSSLVAADSGEVRVAGEPVPTGRAGAMAAAGIGVIPEDRHDSGVVLEMTVAENLALVDVADRWRGRGRSTRRQMRRRAEELDRRVRDLLLRGPTHRCSRCRVATSSVWSWHENCRLSPKVLVAAQPTRGLDVGAIEYMTDRLRRGR